MPVEGKNTPAAGKNGKGRSLCDLLRVEPGVRTRLDDARAQSTPAMDDRDRAEKLLGETCGRLRDLQYQLHADGRFGVLVVLQAMDGGGKDGTIRHVIAAFNPQGCRVTGFKVPSATELKHDFLWRIHQAVPARGEIGVFNRSHYEDVLVVRVDKLVPDAVWQARYEQINAFERILAANDIRVVKFMLHIGKDEQRERLEARLQDPRKHWKFDPQDLEKRKDWDAYIAAYEDALANCSTAHAPWYVIPANRKWYRNYAVARILLETLESLPLQWPRSRIDPRKIVIPD